jgi:hypothetical protein
MEIRKKKKKLGQFSKPAPKTKIDDYHKIKIKMKTTQHW